MEIRDLVYNYKTKHDEGFVQSEIDDLLTKFPDINMDKFNNALRGITCMVKDSETIIYHCDIKHAILCGIENRDLKWYEWD
jgi:hypothetical protein